MTSETMKAWREHWQAYAEAFAQPLQGDSLVSRFVTNPNVTGAYAEAWIRATARNMLSHRFRISTGVARPTDGYRGLRSVPQCDLFVWDHPSSLVSLSAENLPWCRSPQHAPSFEIKRTLTDPEGLLEQLETRRKLLPRRPSVFGVVVSHPSQLFDRECKPDWLSERRPQPPMTRLLDNDNRPDTDGVLAFIYFLAQVAGHNRIVI